MLIFSSVWANFNFYVREAQVASEFAAETLEAFSATVDQVAQLCVWQAACNVSTEQLTTELEEGKS